MVTSASDVDWPAALGARALDIDEADQALEAYAARYGRDALLLLMHAAVPETLRADLLHLIRINFLPELGDAAVEADLLYAPLTQALGEGSFRIDVQVRWQALILLRSRYRHEPRSRLVRVAELMWRHLDELARGPAARRDALLAEYIEVQRWVALAYLDPGATAEAFARALKDNAEAAPAARLRLGGVAGAIELPLSSQPELLAYAKSLDAVHDGRLDEARQWLGALGDAPLSVGSVTLPAARSWWPAAAPGPAPGSAEPAPPRRQRLRCLLIHGYELEPEQLRDAEPVAPLLRETLGERVQVELLAPGTSWEEVLRVLVDVPLVVVDITSATPSVHLLLGIAWALRRAGVVLVAHDDARVSTGIGTELRLRYGHPDPEAPAQQRQLLSEQLALALSTATPTPVHRALPIDPPTLRDLPYHAPERLVPVDGLIILGAGERGEDVLPHSWRIDFFEARWALDRLKINPLRLEPGWEHDGFGVDVLRGLVAADLVLADWTGASADDQVLIGIRCALQPIGTILCGNLPGLEGRWFPGGSLWAYPTDQAGRRNRLLKEVADRLERGGTLSPVYAALPALWPAPLEALKEFRSPAPPAPRRRPVVFISYTRHDGAVADALAAALQEGGRVDLRYDRHVKVGEEWGPILRGWLEEADAVIVVVSARTSGSQGVQSEVAAAIERRKRIVPVFVGRPEWERVPPPLADYHGVFVRAESRSEPGFEQDIAAAVTEIVRALDVAADAPEPARPDPDSHGPVDVSILFDAARQTLVFSWRARDELGSEDMPIGPEAVALIESLTPPWRSEASVALQEQAARLLPPGLRALRAAPGRSLRLDLDGYSATLPWELAFSVPGGSAPDLLRVLKPRPTGMRSAEALIIAQTGAGMPRATGKRPLSRAAWRHRKDLVAIEQALKAAGLDVQLSVNDSAQQVRALLSDRPRRVLVVCAADTPRALSAGMVLDDGRSLGLAELLRLKRAPEFVLIDAVAVPTWDPTHARALPHDLAHAGAECIVTSAGAIGHAAVQAFNVTLMQALAEGDTIESAALRARQAVGRHDKSFTAAAAFQVWSRPGYFLAQPRPAARPAA